MFLSFLRVGVLLDDVDVMFVPDVNTWSGEVLEKAFICASTMHLLTTLFGQHTDITG